MIPRARVDSLAREVRDTVDPSKLSGDVVHWSIPNLDAHNGPLKEPADSIGSSKIRLFGGEVLVSRLNPRKARIVAVSETLQGVNLCSGEFVVLRPQTVDQRFLWYALSSETTRQFLDGHVQSVTRSHQRVRPELVAHMRIPAPPIDPQRRIADFLDAETSRIDALIAAKQQMIETSAEKHRARVIRTLFGSAGAWGRVARLVDLLPGYAFKSNDFRPSGPLRLLRGVNVGVGAIRWDDVQYLDTVDPQVQKRYGLEMGDIVIGMDRPLIGAGMRVAVVEESQSGCLLVQRVARLRTNPGDRSYVKHALSSTAFADYFDPITTGVSIPHISPSQILEFRLPIPTASIRADVGRQLDRSEQAVSSLTAALTRQVELLRERRQALITAAVSGELGVT